MRNFDWIFNAEGKVAEGKECVYDDYSVEPQVVTLADILNNYKTSKETEIQDVAITEIKNRAINYAHKALAGYNFRAILADEAVKMLMNKLIY